MRKSIEHLFREFIYECEFVKKVRPETIRGYVQAFQLFHKITQQNAAGDISSHTVIQFFKTLQERKRIVGKGAIKIGIKKSTAATYWTKLNVFFGWMRSKGYIQINPFKEVKHPTPLYEEKKYLKKEEVEKIVSAIHARHNNNILILKRNLSFFYTLLFCGLRKEEIMLLQIRDIDFERKILTIRGDTSKSGQTRYLPIHSTLIMYLKDYLYARRSYTSSYLFISNSRDERLTYDGLKHLVTKLVQHSGVPFHLHQFRHTFAVNFLKTSNNIAKLRQLLGHKSIAMTMIYLRCLPTDEMRGDIENMSIDKLM